MQFTLIATLGLSALAVAAPSQQDAQLEARNNGKTYCCPKGKTHRCYEFQGRGNNYPKNVDVYQQCSKDLALINVFVCDVLDNNKLNVPIDISLLSS
ncbi:Hypothetical predicted protein [Lecanosticta acicola]|uniref:Uncharacterized protein n=1 Tax=Lecanosticta acicola TaxID=111012 RepID=A0AAI8Z622_9PEZI|nr:Hypothetical predicted protein [Lecanosticta acicola]